MAALAVHIPSSLLKATLVAGFAAFLRSNRRREPLPTDFSFCDTSLANRCQLTRNLRYLLGEVAMTLRKIREK
jgi:hypothetical protein